VTPRIWIVGPKNLGTKFFDEHCMFGNDMDLSPEHQEFLEELCENADENHMSFMCIR
jgi:hypothetical protein